MHVEILRISQDIDLKTGSSSYAAVMELPTGRVIRASVSEEDAKILLGSLVGAPTPPATPPVEYEPPPWAQGEAVPTTDASAYPAGSHIFGGQEQDALPPRQFEEGMEVPVQPPSPPQPRPQRRPRTVQKNDMGYPVVRDGSVDPGEIVSTEGALDEEGIGQG
jgi:hypothetical protein